MSQDDTNSQMGGDFDLPIWKKALDDRNRPYTDEELDNIMPSAGYEIVRPPDGYVEKNITSAPSSQLVDGIDSMSSGGYIMPGNASDALKE